MGTGVKSNRVPERSNAAAAARDSGAGVVLIKQYGPQMGGCRKAVFVWGSREGAKGKGKGFRAEGAERRGGRGGGEAGDMLLRVPVVRKEGHSSVVVKLRRKYAATRGALYRGKVASYLINFYIF